MICSTVFKRIDVGKGYEISLTLNSKYEDFFEEWGEGVWEQVQDEEKEEKEKIG